LEACFVVKDSGGQKLAYVYFEDETGRRSVARRIARFRVIARDAPSLFDLCSARGGLKDLAQKFSRTGRKVATLCSSLERVGEQRRVAEMSLLGDKARRIAVAPNFEALRIFAAAQL
jgi:hypothetical protein